MRINKLVNNETTSRSILNKLVNNETTSLSILLRLAPGQTAGATFTVTSPLAASGETHDLTVTVQDADEPHHNGSATATYAVDAQDVPCIPGTPAVILSPESQSGAPGDSLTYTITVANADQGYCEPVDFAVSTALPADWDGALSLSQNSLSLAPGQTKEATLTVTLPAAGDAYSVAVTVSSPARGFDYMDSVTATIEAPPASGCQVTTNSYRFDGKKLLWDIHASETVTVSLAWMSHSSFFPSNL